tara:strand:+ start:558 stop:1718 length:1161 start_codon:yes stop_codon:yes gene_type:complete
MNNHKLKKKFIHNDSRSSIKNQENKFLETIKKNKESIPRKKSDLEKLIKKYNTIQQGHEKFDIGKKIDELKSIIHDIETNKAEIEYFMNLQKFVQHELDCEKNTPLEDIFNENSEDSKDFFKKTSSNTAGSRYNNYMKFCFNNIIPDDEELIEDNCHIIQNTGGIPILFCKYCKNQEMIVESRTASATCHECGLSVEYQDDRQNPEFREGVQIISPYAYKRINHFKEWLAQLQAKETTEIPDDVINNILAELKKQRITDSEKVTTAKIRAILKKLRYNKYYEHIPTITYRITGRPPPRLSQELELRLINMFREIQEPFAKWVKIEAPERKNFLSYSYTLNKMCGLLGENELMNFFPLLKSRDKNYVQDKIWKGICQDLGWEFCKSV